MPMDIRVAKDALLEGKYIDAKAFHTAEVVAHQRGGTAIDYLLKEGVITRDILGQAIAERLGVSYADLNSRSPSHDQVVLIPEAVARQFRAVVYAVKPDLVIVASDQIPQQTPQSLAQLFAPKTVQWAYSVSDDIDDALLHYRAALRDRVSALLEKGKEAPEIIAEVLEDARIRGASDVHFEPRAHDAVVRFRVDGVLRSVAEFDRDLYAGIVNKIKVDAGMRIDQHMQAQDGSFIHPVEGKEDLQMRVSIVPTMEGEKIAIRILTRYVRGLALSELGLGAEEQDQIHQAAQKPFGMVLVSGPTGSGKTTTLYGLVRSIYSESINITTIEDPVEYRIGGVNQIQVNPQTNLTFADGLKSIVRQDPDVILVGEIRDRETAEIAVNAALTGHLLFSTFHANDAATTIPRLLEMGVEPFILASTLELIVAQRLVRRVCESCRVSYDGSGAVFPRDVSPSLRSTFSQMRLYRGKGCSVCGGTGYAGRTGIFEMIPVTEQMASLILRRPSATEVWSVALQEGARPMFEDGIKKVKEGITTMEELLRVAPEQRE